MTLGYVGALPPGDDGTASTLARMAEIARGMQLYPELTSQVHALALRCVVRDDVCYAHQIRTWLQRHFRFVPDARDVERFATESYLLRLLAENGMISGDCDCLAVLAAGMGLILGMTPRFVVLGFPSTDGDFAHVYTELQTSRGWQDMDTTRPTGAVERASRISTYPV